MMVWLYETDVDDEVIVGLSGVASPITSSHIKRGLSQVVWWPSRAAPSLFLSARSAAVVSLYHTGTKERFSRMSAGFSI